MQIKSAIDLGRMVRISRNQKGWSQTNLAEKLGTSQRWVSEIENGKSRAELGRVLKCLRILDVVLEAKTFALGNTKIQMDGPNLKDIIATRTQLGLSVTDIALIKAMLNKGYKSDAEIQAYFSIPNRQVNMGRISEIRNQLAHSAISPATAEELEHFLEQHRSLLNVSVSKNKKS